MALAEVDLSNCYSRPTKTTRKTEITESVQTDTQPIEANVVAVESVQTTGTLRVRPAVAASLEKSIEQNAAVWTALANH